MNPLLAALLNAPLPNQPTQAGGLVKAPSSGDVNGQLLSGIAVDSSTFLNILTDTGNGLPQINADTVELLNQQLPTEIGDNQKLSLDALFKLQELATGKEVVGKEGLLEQSTNIPTNINNVLADTTAIVDDGKAIINNQLATPAAVLQEAVRSLQQTTDQQPKATAGASVERSVETSVVNQVAAAVTPKAAATTKNSVASTNENKRSNNSLLTSSKQILERLEGGAAGTNTKVANEATTAQTIDALEEKANIARANQIYTKVDAKAIAEEANVSDQKRFVTFNQSLSSVAGNASAASVNSTATPTDITYNNITPVDVQRATETFETALSQTVKRTPSYSNAAEQASIHIAKAALNGTSQITIELEPAHLGRLEVKMELIQEGNSRIVIAAERPETVEQLRNDSNLIRDALQRAGFQTDSGSVDINLKGEGQADKHGSANGGTDRADNDLSLDGEEQNLVEGVIYTMQLEGDVAVDITV